MKYSKIDILEKTPIPYSILHLALPSVLSMIVNILYNLTDTFFIGKLNDPYQVAAVSISLPFFIFQMAMAGIFGNGGGSYLSRLLGKKDFSKAQETTTTAIFTVCIVSVLMTFVGLFIAPQFLKMAGASLHTLLPARQYLTVIVLGSPFTMAAFTMVQLLRAEGAAREAMTGLFIGTGANIVLDPLFIFGFHQGVTGAAVATVIGQALGMLYYISFYLRNKSLAKPGLSHLHLRWSCYKEILFIGVPSSLSQIMMGIGNTISYHLASAYSDHSVAALGVASRVFSIPIFVFIGISIGVQPLIGFNYGAHNYARLKKAIRTAIFISLSLAVGFTLWFALFPQGLIAAFIKDEKIIAIGKTILEAYVFSIPFAAVGMILMTTLQSMGKALPAFIVALSRQGLIYIPMIYLLNHLFQFGGLIFALPLADAMTTVISFSFVYVIVRRLRS